MINIQEKYAIPFFAMKNIYLADIIYERKISLFKKERITCKDVILTVQTNTNDEQEARRLASDPFYKKTALRRYFKNMGKTFNEAKYMTDFYPVKVLYKMKAGVTNF